MLSDATMAPLSYGPQQEEKSAISSLGMDRFFNFTIMDRFGRHRPLCKYILTFYRKASLETCKLNQFTLY